MNKTEQDSKEWSRGYARTTMSCIWLLKKEKIRKIIIVVRSMGDGTWSIFKGAIFKEKKIKVSENNPNIHFIAEMLKK